MPDERAAQGRGRVLTTPEQGSLSCNVFPASGDAQPLESTRSRRRRASGTTGRPPLGRFFCEKSPAGQWCAARAASPPFRAGRIRSDPRRRARQADDAFRTRNPL